MYKSLCFGKEGKPYNYREFIVDNESDIGFLPDVNEKKHGTYQCCAGSIAFVIENKKVYMLSNDSGWKYLYTYGGSSSGGGIDPLDIATIDDIDSVIKL